MSTVYAFSVEIIFQTSSLNSGTKFNQDNTRTLLMISPSSILLAGLRLIGFALALGLTLISFQSYRENQTDRLKAAFVGFAFISIAMALGSLGTQLETVPMIFQMLKMVSFIIGFSMFYISLYR